MASSTNSLRWLARGMGLTGTTSDPAIAAAFDRVLAFLQKQLSR